MREAQYIAWDDLLATSKEATVWCYPSTSDRLKGVLGQEHVTWPKEPPASCQNLIVIGGGTLIDFAKKWRLDHNPGCRLTAIATIWGSGAENSDVAVINQSTKKEIFKESGLLPDYRSIWPDSLVDIEPEQARNACGDTWSHILECFLSPLCSHEVRQQCAHLMQEMLSDKSASYVTWFNWSARACHLQSLAGVGLIHGIAHEIEPVMPSQPNQPKVWGHARLCRTFLYPVLMYNLKRSEKITNLLNEYLIDIEKLVQTARDLFSIDDYEQAAPFIESEWSRIIRNPLTRINSALVMQSSLQFFTEKKFYEPAT